MTTVSAETEALLRRTYEAFNRKDIEAVLAVMTTDVNWPNMLDRVRVIGHDAVRAYWRDQFARVDPSVEPTAFALDSDGNVVVSVHQVVRNLEGRLLVDQHVQHVYMLRGGLVAAMDVRDQAGALLSAPRAT